MTQAPAAPRLGLAILLAALSMVSPFSIDTFFPSFRAISAEFHLNEFQIQQTLTAYVFPYGFMALVHGPLSDALGRRPIVIWGLTLYALASIGCALAPSFATLIAFRAMQGMTAGAGMIAARAIVRDLYDGPQAQQLMSTITMIMGIAPAVAPILGGWIHVISGWRAVFVFMTLIGAGLVVASALRLPETHPPQQRRPFRLRALIAANWSVARHPESMLLATANGLSFAVVLMYIGAAPAIVLDQWKMTETQFAALFVPSIGGFVTGALVSGRLAGRTRRERQLRIGFAIMLAAVLVRCALHGSGVAVPVLAQQTLLFCSAAGVQIAGPILALRLLDLFPHARGSAASVQSFVALMIMAFVFGAVVPAIHGSLLGLAVGSGLAAMLSAGFTWAGKRVRSRPGAA